MTIVWLVEKARRPEESSVARLIGDYAVRAFGSLATLDKLARTGRRARPDVLVVDVDDAAEEAVRIESFVARRFPGTPTILVGGVEGASALPALPKPLDGMAFAAVVARALAGGAARREVLRFRDVELDADRQRLRVAGQDSGTALPPKEVALMRLLLERAGACLTRDEITSSLWPGVKVAPRTIDCHVSRLRRRLEGAEVGIDSVYGDGYVLR
jgi:hypothetical protein